MSNSNTDNLNNESIIKTQIVALTELHSFVKKNKYIQNISFKNLLDECIENEFISEKSVDIYNKYKQIFKIKTPKHKLKFIYKKKKNLKS